MDDAKWIPLSDLTISDNEPPMSWQAVRDLVLGMRVDNRPVEIVPLPGIDGKWRITNGRHRFVAAMMRGKSHIRCQERRE
jgi:hypothetical protein